MSGVRFIEQVFGGIPEDWSEERLVDISELRTSNIDKKSYDGESPVWVCNYVDVYYHDKIDTTISFMKATASKNQIERFELEIDDVIFTKDSESPEDIGIPSLVVETTPSLVCGYHLTVVRPNKKKLHGAFLFYSLVSKKSAHQFYLTANGVTRFGLSSNGTKNIRIALPPLKLQKKISAMLDRRTGQIDCLIAKKRELIEKMKKKQLAVLGQAVTRGFNSDIPLRKSGIKWLGKIPMHWNVKRLKFLVSKVGSGVTPRGGAEAYVEKGFPLFRSQNVHFEGLELDDVVFIDSKTHDSMNNSKVKRGDILLNITGASIGRVNVYEEEDGQANVNQHVCIIRPEEGILTRFMHYVLWSNVGQTQIQLENSGSGREGLNFVSIKNFITTVPPLEEQAEIVAGIEVELNRLKALKENTYKAIDRLLEYRIAVITAAVSGKIDVD